MGRENWFKTGEDGAREAHRVDEENERRRKEAQSGARRFWLPSDKSAEITFLDSLGFFLREHQVYLARSWQNWFTSVVPGTRILTELGAKPIEDISIGEKVLTHKGNFKSVIATSVRPTNKEIVSLMCGKVLTPVTVTYDHKVFYVPQPKTGSGRTGRHREILEGSVLTEGYAEDVEIGDYMFVPKIQTSQKEVEIISEDTAWIYGLYAANGSKEGGTQRKTGICITVSPWRRAVAERAVRVLEDMGYNSYYRDKGNCFRVFACSPDGKSICERFISACGSSTFEKKVPDSVLYGSAAITEAGLQGIVDGDGHNDEGYSSTSFVSTSFRLAMQGFQLALRIGRAASFRYADSEDGIRHSFYDVSWANQGHQYSSHVVDDGMFVKVRNKTRQAYVGMVHDLTVEDDHSFTVDGIAIRNCLSDFDNCPLCDAGMYASYVAMYTIVDHSEYQLKRGPSSGQIVKDQKRLFVVKSSARNKLLKQKERQSGDLTLCRFETTRYTAKECSTGEDFHFIKKATMEEVLSYAPSSEDPQEWIKPFDYAKLFYPKSAEELSKIIGETPPVGAKKPEDAAPASEEIGKYL